jgi:hypothetical protein
MRIGSCTASIGVSGKEKSVRINPRYAENVVIGN